MTRAAALFSLLIACAHRPLPTVQEPPPMPAIAHPPVAARKPHVVEAPAGRRDDPYYWLRDDTRADPEMLAYLNAENAWFDQAAARWKPTEDAIYAEIVGRIAQDDATVPYLHNGWWYYTRFETGKEYPIYARKQGSLDAAEQILVDGNLASAGHAFYQVGELAVSPDNRRVAWMEDTVGRRQYTLHVRDLVTGEPVGAPIANVADFAWANDNNTLLYAEKDPVTLLAFRIRKHALGSAGGADPIVYEQDDPSFYTGIGRSKSGKYLFIIAESTVSSEWRYADAADPDLAFSVVIPRERDHKYSVADVGDRFILRTNWQAPNYRIVAAPIASVADRARWVDVIAHRDEAFIQTFDVFDDYLVVGERSDALRKLRVQPWAAGAASFLIDADEPAYTTGFGTNAEMSTSILRYTYTSLTTPNSTWDYDMRTGERTLKKRDPVLGDFDPGNYQSELVWVPARDGEKIPVSLVYRKGQAHDGTAPLLQYGYGSYGASMDPTFNVARLSLVDRGFVYAIAHIRGGQERGRRWYDDGRMLNKQHTFDDYVDVTRWMKANRYADPDRVFGIGGSAGGLLMGAVANQAGSEYRGLIAHVPFVDVVNTMLDETIPLTTNEFDEWGNPKDPTYYAYMLAYSPYDQVTAKDYPAMLVTTGLWDSQVQYWEAAKWVARLRHDKTGDEPLLLHVNMEAGHGGKSGRFERFREIARDWAFLLDLAGTSP